MMLRFLEELGFLYLIVGLLILIPVLVPVIGLVKLKSGGFIFLGIQLFFIFSIHSGRKDKNFLKMVADKPLQIFIAEYFLLSFPFILLISFTKQWYLAAFTLPFCILIPLLNFSFSKKKLNLVRIPFIPDSAFEWKSGLRTAYVYFILSWIIGAGLSFLVGAVPVAIIILNLIVASFYMEGEPKLLLEVFERSASRFLWFKIKQALIFFWIITLPLVLLFLVFHLQYWYIIAYIVFSATLLLVFSVLQKYAFYEENVNATTRNSLLLFFAFLAFYVPFLIFLLPVMFMLAFRFYKKSLQNLSAHLYAFSS
jgi:hypothetical protein